MRFRWTRLIAAEFPRWKRSIVDVLDMERDMAARALEANLIVVSNRLHETMKKLAVLTGAVAVLSAVFGAPTGAGGLATWMDVISRSSNTHCESTR
jgi:hypothetical protein